MKANIFKRHQDLSEGSPCFHNKGKGSRNSPNSASRSAFASSIFGNTDNGGRKVAYRRGSSAMQMIDDMMISRQEYTVENDDELNYHVPPPVCFSESFMVQPIGHCATMKHSADDIASQQEYNSLDIYDDNQDGRVPPAVCFTKSFMVQPLTP
jgi:hypothetical protein